LRREAREARVEEEVRAAARKLSENGIYPSDWQLQKALGRHAAFREPAARAAHRAVLEELGLGAVSDSGTWL
jgi:hypothetical protein